jgi:hypothetical protein
MVAKMGFNMLNVLLPFRGETAMILFNLDMKGSGILR